MIKIAFATLGCKVNQYETAAIVQSLQDVSIVPFETEADCYIINTCTVTGKTDYQSRQLIRRANRRNPAASVIVTGCYAQRAPEEISAIPGVTIVAGNTEKDKICVLLKEIVSKSQKIIVSDIREKNEFPSLEAISLPGHTRAFLKIQDGCNAFCSYCIVPYTRGKCRSLPEAEVLRRVSAFAANGHREVVLTGIHLGAYGHDFTPAATLSGVIRKIIAGKLVERLRLSSIEPAEVTDELLEMIRDSDLLCRHLHIPLQSGDDRILKDMHRGYGADFFRSLVSRIALAIPDIAIGIDIMVGFPGEDEAAFESTRTLVESLPAAYFHVFPYSRRPGTPASTMTGQVKESVKKERSEILRNLSLKKRESFMQRLIGKTMTVLIESGRDKSLKYMKGMSDNYMPVLITNGVHTHANQIVNVVAEHIRDGKLIGSITDYYGGTVQRA